MSYWCIDGNRRRTLDSICRAARQLLVLALLWLGLAASASAQSFPPTSACTPGAGMAPPQWTLVFGTPDCSTTAAPAGGAFGSWGGGSVPPPPGGESVFISLAAEPGFLETVATTISGLVSGQRYTLVWYVNGNFPTSGGADGSSCGGVITLDGNSTAYGPGPVNGWTPHSVAFVATGNSANFQINATPATQGACYSSVSIEAGAVVPDGTDVRVVKTVSPAGTVFSGSVLTYTLTARNDGPRATTSARLQDTPAAGLDCLTPSPTATCTASGGASCPPTVPISTLTGAGITIPSLPVNGQVVLTMQCKVTATGI